MNGRWQTLTDGSGQSFKNQGQCIAYAMHHPVSLADLASSSVSGTLTSGVGPTGCTNQDAILSATFSGSSAIGAATIQMPGCLLFDVPNFPLAIGFSGTFTITTNVGTLSGTVVGGFTNVFVGPFNPQPVTAGFTLTATAGTGLFTGTSGTLNVDLGWSPPGSEPFFGTISAS
jgi:outer membrane lipoprotein SlyB